jgi:hypothetical protein
LVQRLLDDPDGTAGERDTLVLPILFLFRHYLEIRFKDIIVYAEVLLGQPAKWRQGEHNLRSLWNDAQQLCAAVYGAKIGSSPESVR